MSLPIAYVTCVPMGIESIVKDLVFRELQEDQAFFDETTLSVIDKDRTARGKVVAKQSGVFSGAAVCQALEELFPIQPVSDGTRFKNGDTVAHFEGNLQTILSTERTLLNFLMHLCGIATLTQQYVRAVEGFRTRILATRKTLPGLRTLELAAVTHGGGHVHRRSLANGILIKENHLMVIEGAAAIRRAQESRPPLHKIEIEIQSLDILDAVLAAGPDVVLLDNLTPAEVKQAITRINGRSLVEVSGGITLENIREYAALGVDFISVGRLTHSAPSCDLSLDICPDH